MQIKFHITQIPGVLSIGHLVYNYWTGMVGGMVEWNGGMEW